MSEEREDMDLASFMPSAPAVGTAVDPAVGPAVGPGVGEEFTAHAGADLAAGVARASDVALIDAMKTVHDPEIPVNIYDLGLIYNVHMDEKGDIEIEMSLTAPGCPVAGIMPQQLADAVAGVAGTGKVTVSLIWDPPWTTDRMSDDAKLALDIW